MDVLIVLIIIIAFICISISQSWYDQGNTFRSRDDAKNQGRLTYTKYSKNGQIRQQVWMENGQKGYVLNGRFVNTKGQVIADINQMKVERANQVSKELSKLKGWSFYPYFVTVTVERRPIGGRYMADYYAACWPCIEMSTGKTFVWSDCLKGDYIKSYYTLNDKGDIQIDLTKETIRGEHIHKNDPRPCQFIKDINKVAFEAWQEGMNVRA